jgi:hypothetical protein
MAGASRFGAVAGWFSALAGSRCDRPSLDDGFLGLLLAGYPVSYGEGVWLIARHLRETAQVERSADKVADALADLRV